MDLPGERRVVRHSRPPRTLWRAPIGVSHAPRRDLDGACSDVSALARRAWLPSCSLGARPSDEIIRRVVAAFAPLLHFAGTAASLVAAAFATPRHRRSAGTRLGPTSIRGWKGRVISTHPAVHGYMQFGGMVGLSNAPPG